MLYQLPEKIQDVDIIKTRRRHIEYINQEYELNKKYGFFNKTIDHDLKEFEINFNLLKEKENLNINFNQIISDFLVDPANEINISSVFDNGICKKFSCLCNVKDDIKYSYFRIYTYDKDNNFTGEFEEIFYLNDILGHISKSKHKDNKIEIVYSPHMEANNLHLRYIGEGKIINDSPLMIPVQHGFGKLILFDNTTGFYSVIEGKWINSIFFAGKRMIKKTHMKMSVCLEGFFDDNVLTKSGFITTINECPNCECGNKIVITQHGNFVSDEVSNGIITRSDRDTIGDYDFVYKGPFKVNNKNYVPVRNTTSQESIYDDVYKLFEGSDLSGIGCEFNFRNRSKSDIHYLDDNVVASKIYFENKIVGFLFDYADNSCVIFSESKLEYIFVGSFHQIDNEYYFYEGNLLTNSSESEIKMTLYQKSGPFFKFNKDTHKILEKFQKNDIKNIKIEDFMKLILKHEKNVIINRKLSCQIANRQLYRDAKYKKKPNGRFEVACSKCNSYNCNGNEQDMKEIIYNQVKSKNKTKVQMKIWRERHSKK